MYVYWKTVNDLTRQMSMRQAAVTVGALQSALHLLQAA